MERAEGTKRKPGTPFAWLALGAALLLAVVVARFGVYADGQEPALPLLMLLLMAEFGALLAAAGAVAGFLHLRRSGFDWAALLATVGCAVAALALLLMGLRLWPGM